MLLVFLVVTRKIISGTYKSRVSKGGQVKVLNSDGPTLIAQTLSGDIGSFSELARFWLANQM